MSSSSHKEFALFLLHTDTQVNKRGITLQGIMKVAKSSNARIKVACAALIQPPCVYAVGYSLSLRDHVLFFPQDPSLIPCTGWTVLTDSAAVQGVVPMSYLLQAVQTQLRRANC